MDLTPTAIAGVDAGYWAILRKIRLQKGLFSFVGREYQMELFSSVSRRRCYMKGTQGGFTETEVLRTLHDLIYKLHPAGDLYMFPTNDDVREFSQSRFNPLIAANPLTIGRYVKTDGKGTDTTSLKKIHDAFLYLRGARLGQKRSDDEMESSKLRGLPIDCVKFDEMDLMQMEAIRKAIGRMGDSKIKEEVYISNPGVPGEGIDYIYQKSDQRHWFRKCSCSGLISTPAATTSRGEWTCAELSFPECVKIRTDGTGYIGCIKCGSEVPIWNGEGSSEWVPEVPSNSSYMHGYNWSQLTSIHNDPAEILGEYLNPPEGNLADIVKLRLGQSYIAAEDRLTPAQVFSCCGNSTPVSSHRGPCAAGIDVGIIKHVVIGIRTGRDSHEVLKATALSEWNDIYDLLKRFNVQNCVIDIGPYQDTAMDVQKKWDMRVFLCRYSENEAIGRNFDHKTGIVTAYRTGVFDSTHRLIATPGRLTIPRRELPETKEFVKQCCDAYKLLETNKKTGRRVYRYKGKKEHLRNALNYFLLASEGLRLKVVDSTFRKKLATHCIHETVRI